MTCRATDCHSWCQVLLKSGDKFERVIQHLHNTPVVGLARDYGELRHHLINHQLVLLGLQEDEPSEIAFPNQDWTQQLSQPGSDNDFYNSRAIEDIEFGDSMWVMAEGI